MIVSLVAAISGWGRTTLATNIGPDAAGYTATDSVPFSFEDISTTGTRVLAGEDDSFVSAPLGFAFEFYGTVYTSVFLSSNGMVTFTAGNRSYHNDDLNTVGAPGQVLPHDLPLVAVLWDDWQFFTSGADGVYYQTLGPMGSRVFVAQWQIAYGYVSSPSSVTFQVILYEGSNRVLMQYLDVDSGDSRSFGAQATVGIRDVGGHSNGRRLQWSFNSGVIANGQAVVFQEICDSDGTVDPGEQCDDGNGVSGDGCSATCQIEMCYTCPTPGSPCVPDDGAPCDDSLFCNGADTCSGGTCSVHLGDPCAGGSECNTQCNEAAADCFDTGGTPCTDDGNPCSVDLCDGSGNCDHPAGNPGASCRLPFDPCDLEEFCDGFSTSCPTDQVIGDDDNDGTCNDTDPCTNINPTYIVKARVLIRRLAGPSGNDVLAFRGEMVLPHPFDPPLDPIAKGVRIVLVDDSGTTVTDSTVPSGAYNLTTKRGWTTDSSRSDRWIFRDSRAIGDVTKVVIRDRSSKTPGLVAFSVVGRQGAFPVSAVPVTATFVLDPPTALTGQCGEALFPGPRPAPACAFGSSEDIVTCR